MTNKKIRGMRKRFAALLILAMLASMLGGLASVSAAGDMTLLSDMNTAGYAMNAANGWTVVKDPATVTNVTYGIEKDPAGEDYYLKFSDTSAGGQIKGTYAFPEQSSLFSVEWDTKASLTEIGGRFIIRKFGSQAIVVEVSTSVLDGQLRLHYVRSGNVTIANIQENVWYKVKVNIDMAKDKMDIYVNGQKAVSDVAVTNLGNSSAGDFTFITSWGGSGIGYMRNLKITNVGVDPVAGEVATPPPAPTPVPLKPFSTLEVDKPVDDPLDYTDWKGVTWDPYPVSTAIDSLYDAEALKDDIRHMKYAGVHWVRVYTGWRSKDDGSEELFESRAALDQRMTLLKEAGIKVLLLYKGGKKYGTPEQAAAKAAYLTELVQAYKNDVKHWELGNEANLDTYWYSGAIVPGSTDWDRVGEYLEDGETVNLSTDTPFHGYVRDYVEQLKDYSTVIRELSPEATILLGGLSEYKYEPFLYHLGILEAYRYFDEFAFHPYAPNPDKVIESMVRIEAIINQWPEPYSHLPIWVTEIGWHATPSMNDTMEAPNEAVKAQYLTEVMPRLRDNMEAHSGQARPIIWYAMHEKDPGAGFGLVKRVNVGSSVRFDQLPAIEAYRGVMDRQDTVQIGSEFDVSLGVYAIEDDQATSVTASVYYDQTKFEVSRVQPAGAAAVSFTADTASLPGTVTIQAAYAGHLGSGPIAKLSFKAISSEGNGSITTGAVTFGNGTASPKATGKNGSIHIELQSDPQALYTLAHTPVSLTGGLQTTTITVSRGNAELLADARLLFAGDRAEGGQTCWVMDLAANDGDGEEAELAFTSGSFTTLQVYLLDGAPDWEKPFGGVKANVLTIVP
ncbi:MAG: hypothetical protein K0R57_2037 [Paenibacillaceae bacterium]|nr:hypothetical protein [Paenibacillaceae bacterium]